MLKLMCRQPVILPGILPPAEEKFLFRKKNFLFCPQNGNHLSFSEVVLDKPNFLYILIILVKSSLMDRADRDGRES